MKNYKIFIGAAAGLQSVFVAGNGFKIPGLNPTGFELGSSEQDHKVLKNYLWFDQGGLLVEQSDRIASSHRFAQPCQK